MSRSVDIAIRAPAYGLRIALAGETQHFVHRVFTHDRYSQAVLRRCHRRCARMRFGDRLCDIEVLIIAGDLDRLKRAAESGVFKLGWTVQHRRHLERLAGCRRRFLLSRSLPIVTGIGTYLQSHLFQDWTPERHGRYSLPLQRKLVVIFTLLRRHLPAELVFLTVRIVVGTL